MECKLLICITNGNRGWVLFTAGIMLFTVVILSLEFVRMITRQQC